MPSRPRLDPGALRAPGAFLVAFALAVAACSDGGGSGTTTPPPASGAAGCEALPAPNPAPAGWPAPGTTVTPVLITSPVVCGPNRFLFSFVDANNRPAATPDRSASVALYELGRDADTPIATVQGEFVWAIEDFAGIYVANVNVPTSGSYGAEFVTATSGGASETIRMTFDVQPDSPVVGVGDRAPSSRTPTLADVGGEVTHVSTDDDPDPSFYETSVDEALADHEPFLLVFATPKFCQTAQCGPTLDRIKPFVERYPTVTFINVEPYRLELVDGVLEADLNDDGGLQTVPTVDEWHLLHEPMVFVVDRQGIVQGAFELIFGDAELTAALDEVK
jgi:hypothetical protein